MMTNCDDDGDDVVFCSICLWAAPGRGLIHQTANCHEQTVAANFPKLACVFTALCMGTVAIFRFWAAPERGLRHQSANSHEQT